MYYILGQPKSIEDLSLPDLDLNRIRKQQRILVLDNEEFGKEQILVQRNYNIRKMNDLTEFSILTDYDIILCDINGVGITLGLKHGGQLISEIKKIFPLKPIIMFSAQTQNIAFAKYKERVEGVLNKDEDIEEWITCLDEISKNLANPIHQWKIARSKLLDRNIKLSDILKYEDRFVSSVSNKKRINQFQKEIDQSDIGEEIKNIIIGVISNIIAQKIFFS